MIYEWPVMVPDTTRCLGRQDSLIKKKRQVCQKPVITAIIQFDLICIIKVRYCVAVEATVIPCYYQICDLQDKHALEKESCPQLLAGYD